MTDAELGRRAQAILDDEAFQHANKMAIQQLKDEWAVEGSEARRNSLWHQVQGVNPIVRALTTLAGRGDVIAFERQRQERKVNG